MKEDLVARFTVSIPSQLFRQLDQMSRDKGYRNRSQAVADMIRNELVEHQQKSGSGEIAGTITLVYDHHRQNVQAGLTDIQHDHGDLIIAALHVHLDHHHCMEVLAVRGAADKIREMADKLMIAKGVKHGRLTITSTDKEFEE